VFPPDTKFLIAEDTKTVRALIKDILHNIGYNQIFEAEDGDQALKLMQQALAENDPFGFIIADWNMPGLTGIELLEIRNSDSRFRNIPFLMVTIESERDYVLKAVAMGVSDFVVKPFSESTIKTKIQSIWSRMSRNST